MDGSSLIDQLSVAALLAHFSVRSNVERPLQIKLDSFVGDRVLFLELLRGEVSRDAHSTKAALVLRVTKAINNATLCRVFDETIASFAASPIMGKARADIIEALLGALVREGEFARAPMLLDALFLAARIPTNLRYPNMPVESSGEDIEPYASMLVDGLIELESRLRIVATYPLPRDIHAEAIGLKEALRSQSLGKKPQACQRTRQLAEIFMQNGLESALPLLRSWLL